MTQFPSRLITIAALTVVSLASVPVLAQAQVSTNRLQITPIKKFDPAKLNQLKAINQRYDQRILAAFKGKEALKATMEAELNAIKSEPDAVKRTAMIKAYQAKHETAYKAILRDNQIDMAAIAREMNTAVPDMTFSVVNGLKVVAVSKNEDLNQVMSTPSGSQQTLPAPTPARRVKSLTTTDYTIGKTLGCQNDDRNGISVSGGYMTNSLNVGIMGECENTGSYTHPFTLAENEASEVLVTLDMQGTTEATAALGSASSSVIISVSLYKGSMEGQNKLFGSNIYCDSYASLLWTDANGCELNNITLKKIVSSPGEYIIHATTNTSVRSTGGSGALSEARIKKLRTTITTDTRR